MGGKGEADDLFVVDGEDAATGAAFRVNGKFEGGVDVERGEFTAGGFEKWFGFGVVFDRDGTGVNGHGGAQGAGGGEAEADWVAGDVEALTGEGEDGGVAVGGQAEDEGGAAGGEDDLAFAPWDAADQFEGEAGRGVECGQEAGDRGVEGVAVIGGQVAALHGEAD